MHIWRTLKGVKPSIRLAASLIVRTRFLGKKNQLLFFLLLNKMLTQMKVLYVALCSFSCAASAGGSFCLPHS